MKIKSATQQNPLQRTSSPFKIRLHIKNVSYASRALVHSFARTISALMKRLPDVQKADVTIKEKKKGALYEAAIDVVRKGKHGFKIKLENPDLKGMLVELHKKLRQIVQKGKR